MADDDPLDSIVAGQATHEFVGRNLYAHRGVDACRRCVQHVNQQIEAKFDQVRAEGMEVACKPGCSYCCHLRVSILPHEAIALFSYLRSEIRRDQRLRIEQKIQDNAARIAKMTREEHYATNIACAFLEEGMCMAHTVRPSACSGYHSMDVHECERTFNEPDNFEDALPVIFHLRQFGEYQQDASRAALDRLGLVDAKGELHLMLAALLRTPNLIERWGRGGAIVRGEP